MHLSEYLIQYCKYNTKAGLEIHFFGGSKLLLPSSKPGSKTNFVVANCMYIFTLLFVLGCVDDRLTNITQKCITFYSMNLWK